MEPHSLIDRANKTLKHKGEAFDVSVPADCALTVTVVGLTAKVSVKGSHYVIRIVDTKDNGQLYSPDQDPIVAACNRILDFSPKSRQELCNGLSQAFTDL